MATITRTASSELPGFFFTHDDRQGVDTSFTVSVCVRLFVCTVTDFSVEDKASGVKFCTAVHRRLRQGISHFCELSPPRSLKSDESASPPPPPQRSQRLPFGFRTHDRAARGRRIGMCGYTSVSEDGRNCCFYSFSFVFYPFSVPCARLSCSSRPVSF